MTIILKKTDISIPEIQTTGKIDILLEMDSNTYKLSTPLTEEKLKKLKAGDIVYLSGTVYGARDAAHRRIVSALISGSIPPIGLKDITIFYVGPSPTPPGRTSGSIGPTTSARMDDMTEPLLEKGLRAMIGKGRRSNKIKDLLKKYGSVYLVSIGGISAYLSTKVKDIKAVAYRDLGAEAIYEITLKDFPVFVAYDIYGGDIFDSALLNE